MNFGLIARADNRGLGIMTWELYQHLHVDRVLVIREPGAEQRGFVPHLERYPDAIVTMFDGGLDEATVRGFLEGLDVVYSAETFYDPRLVSWAREADCATVLHVMPEFFPATGHPEPDAIWVPTTWRLEQLPARARVVPVPVATDRFASNRRTESDGPLRVLHVAGHRAAMDRNGTQAVLRATAALREEVEMTISGQDGRLPSVPSRRGRVRIVNRPRAVTDYWQLYRDQDVLVMPRRYGGLSLPVQEGMAAGLVPVMTDVSPNGDWPAILVPSHTQGMFVTAAGALPLAQVKPRDLAAVIDALARDRDALADLRADVDEWVGAHSWDALGPLYETELKGVA